jgi:hypothetical protein
VVGQGPDEALEHGAGLDPAHVEGGLVGQRVEVEQLHGDSGGELLGGFEEAHEQGGLDEVVDQPFGNAGAEEQLVCCHAVVGSKGPLIAIVIQHRV